jgi:SulP family sulfate permease
LHVGGGGESALIFASLRGLRAAWLPGDLVAGLVLAAIALPEQIATARLAHMPAQTGLFAFAAGSLAFAVFGANPYLSIGADSTIAPIFAGSIATLAAVGSPRYPELVGVTALLAGTVLVIVGVLRAGWIADLLSIPVTIGLLAGISVRIVVGQLPLVLGIREPTGMVLAGLVEIVHDLPHANVYTAALGSTVLALAVGAERVSAKVPGTLIGLAGAGVAVAGLHLTSRGVAVLGPLPSAFPRLSPPLVDLYDVVRLVPVAFIVALVCIVQTAAVLRAFPSERGKPQDLSREFAAVGLGSIAAMLIGALPVNASPPRTAVVSESGGRSQLTGILAVVAIAAVLLFASRLAAYLPLSAFGGVLIFIGMRIFRLRDMLRIARYGGGEIWFVAVGALLVIVLPIEAGMLLSIALSLAHGVYIVARPPSAELARIRGTTIWWPPSGDEPSDRIRGVVVFAPAAPITFTNAQFIVERLRASVAGAAERVRLVVIEGGGVIDVDYTGSQVLLDAVAELRARGIEVAIARLSDERAQAAATRTGLVAALGRDHVFKSVQEAVAALGQAPTGTT